MCRLRIMQETKELKFRNYEPLNEELKKLKIPNTEPIMSKKLMQ